jgi:hypothetical protein
MRPVTVSIGPSLSSTANNIATSQTPAGTSTRAAVTFTANNASLAATNAFVAGQQVQFQNVGGSQTVGAAGFVVGLPPQLTPQNNYFVIATGLSTTHFEVAATLAGTAITPTTAGTGTNYVVPVKNVALNGTLVSVQGVAVLPTPQRVLITTADSTTVFTIVGADKNGNLLTENLTSNGTSVQSTLDYATITAINVNQTTTAAITVGTNGVGSTSWVRLDEWANTQCSIQIDVVGTVNYSVQSSMDDPNSATNPVTPSAMVWISSNDTNVVGATSSLQTNYLFAPTWVRCLLNSGSGSISMTVAQANVANR